MSVSTAIEVTTRHNPLAWLLYFTRPTVLVDGQGERSRWGTTIIPTTPGRHIVTVFFRYLTKDRCGENSIAVEVREGQTTSIDFYMPPLVTAKGRMAVR